jgi:hypothetical protein
MPLWEITLEQRSLRSARDRKVGAVAENEFAIRQLELDSLRISGGVLKFPRPVRSAGSKRFIRGLCGGRNPPFALSSSRFVGTTIILRIVFIRLRAGVGIRNAAFCYGSRPIS